MCSATYFAYFLKFFLTLENKIAVYRGFQNNHFFFLPKDTRKNLKVNILEVDTIEPIEKEKKLDAKIAIGNFLK